MTDMTQPSGPEQPGDQGGDPRAAQLRKPNVTRRGGGEPADRGRTTIADGVVEKIAGMRRP